MTTIVARRPDLFIIGAAKSGTTSLYHYLGDHPQVYMSPDKEPNYFAPDMAADTAGEAMRYPDEEARYLKLFAGASDELRLGEASTRYLMSSQAPALVRSFQPEAYIVAMLRNPIDMVYSMHGQRLAEGEEDIAEFAEALAAEDERRNGRRIPAGSKNPALATYLDRARYAEQLRRWIEAFGAQRVHVLILEEFMRDPAREFERLLEFLQIDTAYRPSEFAVHNPSHAPRSATLRGLLNTRRPRSLVRRVLSQSARDRVRREVIRPIRRLNRRTTRRAPLSLDLRRRLESEFAADVAATGELIDRDLARLWFGSASIGRS